MKAVLFVAVACAVVAVAFGAACGGDCSVDTDCNGSVCQACMGGKCGSGCSSQCGLDTDCRDPNCRYCYNGYCGNSPNRQCNQTCQVNTDCDQLGDCAICSGNKCTAGCGQACKNSTECVGTTCHMCILGKCSKDDVQCNSKCTTNTDCFQGSFCNLCITGNCGAGCGQKCSADSQCVGQNCGYCTNGFCRPEPAGRTCQETCVVDSDCNGTPGSCNQCYLGRCGSTCSKACKASTDCVTHGCGVCTANSTCGYV